MKVQVLGEAQQDLVGGYRFYESQVAGLGDYFLDSLFSAIDSLQFCGGVHAQHPGYTVFSPSAFLSLSIIALKVVSRGCMPFWIAGEIHPGFATDQHESVEGALCPMTLSMQ